MDQRSQTLQVKGIPVWLELIVAALKGSIQTHRDPLFSYLIWKMLESLRSVAAIPVMDCVQLVVDISLTLSRLLCYPTDWYPSYLGGD